VAAALLLVLVAVVAALHVRPVQRALFDRATSMLEDRTGLRVAAESVRLRPFGIRLELIHPSFAAAAAEPFLTADSLTVEVTLGSLTRGPLVVREAVLVGPRFDGSRPLPRLPPATADESAEVTISIASLRLRDGAAAGLEPPSALRSLLGAVRLDGVEVDGGLVGGELYLAVRVGRLRATPDGRQPLDLGLAAELSGPLAGPLMLDRLQIDGDSVAATVSGRLGLEEDQPLMLELEGRADIATLLGIDAAAEPVRLAGQLDLRALAGALRLEGGRLPGELASLWVPAELYQRSGLPGSWLGLTASLELEGGRLDGTAEARWARGEGALAEATVTAVGELTGLELPRELDLGLDLELLPRVAGRRQVEARLVLAPAALGDSRIESGRLRLAVPDLEAELVRLAAVWPGMLPDLPAGLAAGPLRVDGSFGGSLADPAIRLGGEWSPAPGASARLSASGAIVARRLDIQAGVDGLPLSRLVAGAVGTLTGSAELALAGDRLTGEVRVEGERLGRGELELQAARLAVAIDGDRVRVRELVVEQADRILRGTGDVELGAAPAADLALELIGGWGPLRSAEGRLRLAGGVLRLDVPRADLAGSAATLAVAAPLAPLSRLPGGEALAALVVAGADGPLEIDWDLPAIDWQAAFAGGEAVGGDELPSRWVAGSRGRLSFDPAAPAAGSGEVELVDLQLERDGRILRSRGPLRLALAAGRLRLAPAALEVDGHELEVAGEAGLRSDWSPVEPPARLVEEARLGVQAAAAAPLSGVDLALLLRQSMVLLEVDAPLVDGGHGWLRAAAPLAALAGGGEGLLELSWDVPAADWTDWLSGGGDDRALERLVAGTGGRLELDLAEPSRATGELRIPRLEAELGDQSLQAREPIELRLGDGRLRIESARLSAAGAPLDLSGWIDLEPGWRPGAAPAGLLRELSLRGGGVLPAALLNPFLAGGAGEGALLAELEIAGPGEALEGKLELTGAGAGFYFVSPYSLEVAAPELTLRFAEGEATFTGEARVNEGRLGFSGTADGERGLALEARIEAIRAVLDYGLLTLLDGDLRLTVDPGGAGLLSGRLTVDRGQLTRPIRLDSLLLSQLLPTDLLGSDFDPLESIALDLSVETRQGIRVKNNLADLKLRWQPLAVRGDLVRPIIEGRLEVDSGGLVYAYGQTVRLDSAAVVYRGLPEEVPTLELQTTTSFEDPSIGRLAGNDAFAEERLEPEGDTEEGPGARAVASEALTTGLASFLGEQFSKTVGEALGGTRISFRPLLIFGEADPGARLTASSDLSARATLAASIDLRNAERQTYLLDLHDEKAAARLSAQLFTNDLGGQGSTLQQRLELGGGRQRVEGPRLRRLRFDPVPGVRRRGLRRAAGYRKGDRLADGAAFEIAVAVGELLRGRGYPDARVRVAEQPAAVGRGVELAVRIEPGPRVEFRFTGQGLPRPLRRAVTELYRGDFYEPTALEEMRTEAVRAWRSRGHLEPRVEARRELLPGGPPERRRVTIDSDPGERVELAPPRFAGLPELESAQLAALFDSPLRRAELAVGLEAAERRALSGLAALGYPEAVIAGRQLSPDGLLAIEVETGERLTVAVLEFVDSSGLQTEVGEAGGVTAGEPVRADRLARAALEVEQELRQAGYLDAEVTLHVEPLGPDRPFERKAVFALDRGPIYRLAAVEFEGLGATRPAWARRTAGLVEGDPLAPTELREARRRLYGTGLFSAVGSEVGAVEEGGTRVLFEVEEQPRFRFAYGLRWESEEGTSLVVDALDRNFLGRGVDLGLRSLWSDEVQQLRLSGSIPGVLGPRSRLELFALAGDEEKLIPKTEDDKDCPCLAETRTVEGTVQLGWQFGRRTTGRIYGRYRDIRSTETFLVDDPYFAPLDIEASVKRHFLGLQYIFDGRDDRVKPGRGLFASLDLSYSDKSLGGDIRYVRLFGQLNSFRPAGRLAGRRLTWAQSVRLGRAEAFSGHELAEDLLLLAGGEYSVRGYRRETLGLPELASGFPPSAEYNSLFVLNEELRFEIWDLLSGLLFLDAGNVWIYNDIDFDLFTSLGLGLRADTPFGLLRLDVAVPLDRREGIDPDVKLYFGLGNVF
jgi:outer membrane protein assembly factor BamA